MRQTLPVVALNPPNSGLGATISNTVVIVLRRLGEIDPPSDTFSLVLTVPLLVTNLTATALMTYKTWCVRFTILSLIARAKALSSGPTATM